MNYSYPSELQSQIELTEVTNQKLLEIQFTQDGKIIEKNFKIQNSQISKSIIIETSVANASAEKVKNEKESLGVVEQYNSAIESINYLKNNKLYINTDNNILYAYYISMLKNSAAARQLITLNNINSNDFYSV